MFDTIKSPLGNLKITSDNGHLTSISYTNSTLTNKKPNPNIKETVHELNNYFKNPRHAFSIQLEPAGTDFQKKVWRALQKIPTGRVVTYGTLAKKLGTSPRAIGNACRKNPIPIIIPCHRVVAQNHLGGYSGSQHGKMLNIKKWLIHHESGSFSCDR